METNNNDHKESNAHKLLSYMQQNQNFLNVSAVFSDGTEFYKCPLEPVFGESVTLKIRTGKGNVDKVVLHLGDKDYLMESGISDQWFDYHWVSVKAPAGCTLYYYEIFQGPQTYFYNQKGVVTAPDESYHFQLISDFQTPDWAKGAVFYQIFVDRFCNGDPSNDVVKNEYIYLGKGTNKTDDWQQLPQPDDVRTFYGGDLQGIINKLDYIAELGIEVIYLNPIFVSPSNHKYDIQDYDYVDPHVGKLVKDSGSPLQFEKFRNRYASMYMERTTDIENLEASNQLFAELVDKAHKKGIKVILDGVFNHCGAFNKWLDREGFYKRSGYPAGAYAEKESPYHNFFKWYDQDNWPNNDAYDGWWGYDNHPKLFYENSQELYDYILKVGQKWVSAPFHADGWRLDVAADLGYSKEFNHQFWRDFRRAVKQANPEAIILAEHYGSPQDWLQGDQWDTVMNYDAFMEPITWFLTGMEKHSEEFRPDLLNNGKAFADAMRYHMSRYSIQSLQVSMNELSNHDHSRFLTRTNQSAGRLHTHGSEAANAGIRKSVMKEAVIFQMTWPGAPTVYYGDEAGLCGWTDPDNRRTYPWGHEDRDLLEFHKTAIKIHKSYQALKIGSVMLLNVDYGVLSYGRVHGVEKLIVVLNNLQEERQISVPVWVMGIGRDAELQQLLLSDESGFDCTQVFHSAAEGEMQITMPPVSGMILKARS